MYSGGVTLAELRQLTLTSTSTSTNQIGYKRFNRIDFCIWAKTFETVYSTQGSK